MGKSPLQLNRASRRRVGPVVVGILFFIAACGISLDFLARQFEIHRHPAPGVVSPIVALRGAPNAGPRGAPNVAPNIAPTVAVNEDPFADDLSMIGPDSPIGRSDSSLPFSSPWPTQVRRTQNPSERASEADPADEPIEMARGKVRAPAQFEYEAPPEDLKIDLNPSLWKGAPQLLPSPMYVSQLTERRALDIRGDGWVIIDVNRAQILKVELFKSRAGSINERRVIEAKYPGGSEVVNPNRAGFVIARGIPRLQPGGFEVFENPDCLTRFSNVRNEEICEVTVRGNKTRFKFKPPVPPAEGPLPDFMLSDVFVDMGKLGWKQITAFNENFYPLGDPNRDGYPDFLVESITGADESGVHILLMSEAGESGTDYTPYTARFKGY